MPVLTPEQWSVRAQRHAGRVSTWVAPHLHRARRGEAHPVLDFLFTYYTYSPGALRRWHPGPAAVLAGDPPHRGWTGYRDTPDGVTVAPLAARRVESARASLALLRATADRAPFFGCAGLHEWAMVYRTDRIRHGDRPLRLTATEVAEVVEAGPLRCTHFDAFRFFTAAARPRNVRTLSRAEMPATEQGGCLHTNMDLYKHAYRLGPHAPSELVADCFELARELRELDMRASPYDLTELGYEPVPIETPPGRAAYAAAQRELADRAAGLRGRLIALMADLLAQ